MDLVKIGGLSLKGLSGVYGFPFSPELSMMVEELSKNSEVMKATLFSIESMVGQIFVANFRAAKIALENANDSEISAEDRKQELLHAKQMFELAYEQFSGIPVFVNYKADVALYIAFCNVALERVSRAKDWLAIAEMDFKQFLLFDTNTIYTDRDLYSRWGKLNQKGRLFSGGLLITIVTAASGGLAIIPAVAFTAWSASETWKERNKIFESRDFRDEVLKEQDTAKQQILIIVDLAAQLPAANDLGEEEIFLPYAE